jgi:hypothetical protein
MWWIAPAMAAATAAFVYLAPMVSTMSDTMSMRPDGTPAHAVLRGTTSLRASQGSSILIPILIPVLLAALPLAGRDPKSRQAYGILSAALLGVFILLGSMSIGMFYVPTLLALIAALLLDRWLAVKAEQLPADSA